MSAVQLSRKYEIPLNCLYPRMQKLTDVGLITVVKCGRTSNGKWYDLYRSPLLRVDVTFDDVALRVEATIHQKMADKFTQNVDFDPPTPRSHELTTPQQTRR